MTLHRAPAPVFPARLIAAALLGGAAVFAMTLIGVNLPHDPATTATAAFGEPVPVTAPAKPAPAPHRAAPAERHAAPKLACWVEYKPASQGGDEKICGPTRLAPAGHGPFTPYPAA